MNITKNFSPSEHQITAYSMLTRDGRRLVSYEAANGERIFELVPVEKLPADLPSVRPWKINAIKASHTDIGLHNSQYIQRHGSIKRIEDAIKLIDSDARADDDPAAYRYTCEGTWFWENYPMDRGEEAARKVVEKYIRRGRMDVGAYMAGNHTHLFGPEELRRSLAARKRLVEKWGIDSHTMIMADNPGMSWSLVKPLAEGGVDNIVFAPNQWNPIPSTLRPCDKTKEGYTWNPDAGGGGNLVDVRWDSNIPMLFWWESQDRSARVLIWSQTQYQRALSAFGIYTDGVHDPIEDIERKTALQLAKMEARYPYDLWLTINYSDDEPANTDYADFCAKWNEKWVWPQFGTVGKLDEAFDYVKARWGADIPIIRGEMTSGWLQHAASTPELLAQKLNAERMLAAGEERWLTDANRDESLKTEIDRAWWMLMMNDEHSYGTSGYTGRRVFETWMQHRDWIERVESLGRKLVAGVDVAVDRTEVKGEAENDFYRIITNAKGEIISIFDKELEREIIDGPANHFLYTRDNHRTWADESELGAEITRKVYLANGEKRIEIEDNFKHAADLFNTNRYYRYGYIAFPFAVPGGEFKAALGGGEVIDPYRDQTGLTTDAYVGVRDWCAVENGEFGVALFERDTVLTEFGEIHPDKTCLTMVPPKGKSAIYSYAFTDWLQMHQPDGESMNFTFRYAITSYRGNCHAAGIAKAADRYVNPWRSPDLVKIPRDCSYPDTENGKWTGLIEEPRAGHGENQGQLYLLWGAEMSPDFDHYELYRDGQFVADVYNEIEDGIPYRVARYEDTGLASHTRYTYRLRKIWKDGRKGELSKPFSGLTRE